MKNVKKTITTLLLSIFLIGSVNAAVNEEVYECVKAYRNQEYQKAHTACNIYDPIAQYTLGLLYKNGYKVMEEILLNKLNTKGPN